MKRIYKVTSLILSIVLLFSACGKVTSETALNKIKSYLETNDYSACKEYVTNLENNTISTISNDALKSISMEFDEIYKSKSDIDIFDLSSIDSSFIEKCDKLWSIASTFTPNDENQFDENLIMLRYFSELTDTMRYKEMYKFLKALHTAGYLDKLSNALNDYEELGEYSLFEDMQKASEEFKYSNYDPQEYYITELRNACEKTGKYLVSVNNGFATNDTVVIATAINNLLDTCNIFYTASKNTKSVCDSMNNTMNHLKTNGAFSKYTNKINLIDNSKYESGQDFELSLIFGANSNTNDDSKNESNNENSNHTLSKEDAIRITVNAINQTKAYGGKIQIEREQNVYVQMTSFNTVSEVTNTVTLVREKINDALNKSNGKSKGTKTYVGGVSGDLALNNSIPPAGRYASLQPSLVETYSAVKGTGGYVITFTLYPCTSTDDNMSYNLLSIVDGFYFDEQGANLNHKSYYGPTQISATVNNSGYLSNYSYTINGVADCKFLENGEHVATGEFKFNNQFSYKFTY